MDGQRKGYRGRVAMYVPPLLEALGLVEPFRLRYHVATDVAMVWQDGGTRCAGSWAATFPGT